MAQYMPYPPQPPSQGSGGYPASPPAYGSYPPPQAYDGYPAPAQGSGSYPLPPVYSGYPAPAQGSAGYPLPPAYGSSPAPQIPGAYPSPQLPPEVQQQAASYQLGTLVQVYKPSARPFIMAGIVVAAAILDIIVMITEGFGSVLLPIIAIVAIVFAVRVLLNYNLKVYAFAEGLVRAKGTSVDVVRWDQIEAVWQKSVRYRYYGLITLYTWSTYTVRRGDGAQFKFNSILQEVGLLGDTIEKEVARRHLPRAIAAYNSGGPVYFGPLVVSMQGIGNGVRLLPWHEVGQVSLRNGWVIVPKVTNILGGFRARMWKVPNVQVFLQLVDYARRRPGGR